MYTIELSAWRTNQTTFHIHFQIKQVEPNGNGRVKGMGVSLWLQSEMTEGVSQNKKKKKKKGNRANA